MNWKQSAKAAAIHIEVLEKEIERLQFMIDSQRRDIQDYNKCILSLISGDSACVWCEERTECQRECKDGKNGLLGCQEWWLRFRKAGDVTDEQAEGSEQDSILSLEEQ